MRANQGLKISNYLILKMLLVLKHRVWAHSI
jgi:hypothetical protein